MSALRILFDDRPVPGGVGRYARALGAQLQALPGHECLTLSSLGLGPDSPEALEQDLPALMRAEDIEVFHSPRWHLPALLPGRSVVTVHDAAAALEAGPTRLAARLAWRRATDAASRADAVVTPGAHAREQVLDVFGLDPARVHVVPEHPDAAFHPRSPEQVAAVRAALDLGDAPFVLVVGPGHGPAPGQVLDAYGALPAQDRPGLVFVGPPAGLDVPAQAARRGLGARVRQLDTVPDEALAALYTGAALVLCAGPVEGSVRPVLEAWACAAPVVAARDAALHEVACGAARLAPLDDPHATALVLQEVLTSEGRRAALRARGRERLLERHSPAAVQAALARVYDALAARSVTA